MRSYLKALALIVLACGFVWLVWHIVSAHTIAVLEPKGLIALEERNLVLTALVLMLAIVIPVFFLTAIIAWRYRATNTRAKYLPDWEHNTTEEFIWWAVPCVIVIILASLAFRTSFALDPFRPLASEHQVIEVVSLNWKWLFIYPKEGIASVNFVEFPVGRPVEFRVTSDAPMNSFWIPQLGGQIYAMTGMITQLHLIADQTGSYFGASANISGKGFSDMTFLAKAVQPAEFDAWIKEMKKHPTLDDASYAALAEPGVVKEMRYYGTVKENLFDRIVFQYNASMPMHHDED